MHYLSLALALAAIAIAWAGPQPGHNGPSPSLGPIAVDAVSVPLNPRDPSAISIGEFRYAGGLALRAYESDLLHELSDLVVTDNDHIVAVGDEGVRFDARITFDENGQLVGIADANIARLIGENGRPLMTGVDAEGLALLPSGDFLVSFERRPRIWLYPKTGAPPRAVPSPRASFRANEGMEALTADPDAGADAYIVGVESSGATWNCRAATSCTPGPSVDKPTEFGLVSMTRLPEGMTAYLLRAYDSSRGARITLKILRGQSLVARLDLAPPMTVDNFEGIASVPAADGQRRRFYMISDDNNSPTQRTLLLAFDWLPKSK